MATTATGRIGTDIEQVGGSLAVDRVDAWVVVLLVACALGGLYLGRSREFLHGWDIGLGLLVVLTGVTAGWRSPLLFVCAVLGLAIWEFVGLLILKRKGRLPRVRRPRHRA